MKESNGNKYLTQIHTGESKGILWRSMKNYGAKSEIIKSVTNDCDNDGKIYMKIKFKSDSSLSLMIILKLLNMIIVVKPESHEGNKFYPQVFWDECLYKL